MGPRNSRRTLMKDLVPQAMEQGALGLSSGLEYLPGGFASTEEIVEVALYRRYWI